MQKRDAAALHPPMGFESRRIRLHPFTAADEKTVYDWHCDPVHRHLWTEDRDILPFDRFIKRFNRRLERRMDLFFMVRRIKTGLAAGFVYNYAADSVDRNCYLSVFMDPLRNPRGAGIDAALLFLNHLFNDFGYRKVYSEVYSFNETAVRITEKAGFVREGCLTEHRWWNGRFWDQYIYSLTADTFNKASGKYTPFLLKHRN